MKIIKYSVFVILLLNLFRLYIFVGTSIQINKYDSIFYQIVVNQVESFIKKLLPILLLKSMGGDRNHLS